MRRLFIVLSLLFVLLLLALPVAAQEVTAVPDVPPVVEAPSSGLWMDVGELALLLALSVFGGGGILAILFRFLDRKDARDTGEKLYQSIPPGQQQFMKDVIEGYRKLSERLLSYLEAITDGLPNEDVVAVSESRNYPKVE